MSSAFGTATTGLRRASASKRLPDPAWLTMSAADAMCCARLGAKSKYSACKPLASTLDVAPHVNSRDGGLVVAPTCKIGNECPVPIAK
jgi:hypothetical protein